MRNLIINAFIALLLIPINSFAHEGHGGRGRPGYGHGRPGYGPDRRPGYGRHGNGYILHPIRFYPGAAPIGGWRGRHYFYNEYNYYLWTWGPYAPFYGWNNYYGWRLGLYYYIPEGLKCFADNPAVQGEWTSQTTYYHSDDAINSALGMCESDPAVQAQNAQDQCRIRNCVHW